MELRFKTSLEREKSRISEISPEEARDEWKKNSETYNPDGMITDQIIYRCYLQDALYMRSLEDE